MLDKNNVGVTKQVIDTAYRIITEHPDGIRFSELVTEIKQELPDLNHNMINAQISALRNHSDYEI